MAKLTVCPKFFFSKMDLETPDRVESELIQPFTNLIKELKEKNLRLTISEEIYTEFHNKFPWNKTSDSEWKQYVSTWNTAINSFFSLVDLISHDINDKTHECTLIEKDVSDIFLSFLDNFTSILLCSKYYENGISTDDLCQDAVTCKKFQLLKNYSQLDFVKFTWLSIYDSRLPTKGKISFEPTNNWERLSGPKKNSATHDYIDKKGMEWGWDLLHQDHWDVQLNNGTGKHLNIFPDGRIRK